MALRPLPNVAPSPAPGRLPSPSPEDQARLRRYAEQLDFYEGKQWARPRPGRTNLTVNYARAVVDKGVSYLAGRGINFSVPPAGPSPEEEARAAAAEELLYRVYEENDLEAVDVQGATNGAILGDTVFKVFWQENPGRVRVVNVDPFRFFPRWAEDDISTLLSVRVVYRAGEQPAPAGRPSLIAEEWTDTELTLEVDGREAARGPNPYGFIPFVHIPNARPANQFWGVSDLKELIPLNRELNERMSDVADSIRFHSDPPVVFKGVREHSNLAVGPGTVWDLPEGAEVELLEWRGQGPAVQDHIERVMRAIHDVTETPKTSFGDSGRLLSGVALETELQPLIQKTLRKRAWWNAGLRRRNAMILRIAEMKGLGEFAPYRSRVIWPPLMPADSEAEVRNNVALVSAGLRSRRTAMDRLGEESPEEELERMRSEGWEGGEGEGLRAKG